MGSVLGDWHRAGAWVVVFANAFAAGWALGAHRWDRWRHPSLWVVTAAAQILIFVQVALGVAWQSTADIEAPDFHLFYGFVALATVGIIYSYRAQLSGHIHLLYGGGGLFLMGLAIRAMLVG